MSTYTDLHNRVKENIAVDYNNRITSQRVRFLNEQNEFLGTLRGNVSAENINIMGGTLSGVTLQDAILSGQVTINDDEGNAIDLVKVGADIIQLSTDLDETNQRLQEIDQNVQYLSTELVQVALSLSAGYTGDISNVVVQLTQQDANISTLLCTYINNEASARTSNDNSLSDAITDVNFNLIGEINDRIITDNIQMSAILSVQNASIVRDTALSVALSAHNQQNLNDFIYANTKMLSTVEHERHYVINDNDPAKDYPYVANDYEVNVFRANVPDGRVTYEDPGTGEIIEIGRVTLNLSSSPTVPLTFTPYLDIDNNAIASVLVGNKPYNFTELSTSTYESKAGYDITYGIPAGLYDLSNATFELTPRLPSFHKVNLSGTDQMIGKFSSISGDLNNMSSGWLFIDTTDAQLQTFNKYTDVYFNISTDTEVSKETEKITYLGNNLFKLEKNIDIKKYIQLTDISNIAHDNFGRIYDLLDGISGIISNDIDGITDINVKLNLPISTLGYLNIANNFTEVISTTSAYELVLSATVNNTSADIDVVQKSELYGYNFVGPNVSGDTVVLGTVTPIVYNTHLTADPSYDQVSVDIRNIMDIEAFANVYVLDLSSSNLWTYQTTDDNGNILNLNFNGTSLYTKTTSIDEQQIVRQQYEIDILTPAIANPDTCHTLVYCTGLIDLDQPRSTWPEAEATDYATVDPINSINAYPSYTLDIDTANNDTVKIVFPTKNPETPEISREFLIVIKLDSITSKTVRAEFVYADGLPVTFYNNKHTYLDIVAGNNPTDWVTYMVNEVRPNKFLITDLNDYEDHQLLIQLRTDLDAEISNRIAGDNNLCTEIQTLSTSLQEQILSNDADIADIYNKIQGGINYKGNIYGEIYDSGVHITAISAISNLFVWPVHGYSVNGYTEDTVLSNGYMYIMQGLSGSTNTKFVIEGLDIETRDYVIINYTAGNGKAIKDLTVEDINIIDAEDSDTIHRPELDGISSFLSTEINANDADITYLSNDIAFLSAQHDALSTSLQEQILSNDNDIAALNISVSYLVDVDKKVMIYNGTLLSTNTVTNSRLTTFLEDNFIDVAYQFEHGGMYHLSVSQSLSDVNNASKFIGANDYIIFNKDVILSDVIFEDIDLIRDAEAEALCLQVILNTKINKLSDDLSNDINLIQQNINLSIGSLCSEISANDIDIAELDAQMLSINTRYSQTFTETDKQFQPNVSSDNLIITDPFTHLSGNIYKQYYVSFESGTLVLKPIN